MKDRRCVVFCVVASGLASACHHAHKSDAKVAASTAPAASAIAGASLPARLGPLVWTKVRDLGGLGIPDGCTMREPTLEASLPEGTVRFVAPGHGSPELVLAIDEDRDGIVDRDAVLDGQGKPGRALPWRSIDAPPLFEKSASGWVSFDVEGIGNGARQIVIWRESGARERLLSGDRLELSDASCDGATCGVLTTLAGVSAGPGATLMTGDPKKPSASWKRVDLPPDDPGDSPFSFVQFSRSSATVALSGSGAVSVSRVEGDRVTQIDRFKAPFGVYDVLAGERPIAVLPGESIDKQCGTDGFFVNLLGPGGKHFKIDGQVPPSSVVSRPIDGGFIVAWLARVSCHSDARKVVRAFLVGPDGAPRSSTMAVSDAQGFALAARGNAVDIWLAKDGALIWIKAGCQPHAEARNSHRLDAVDALPSNRK